MRGSGLPPDARTIPVGSPNKNSRLGRHFYLGQEKVSGTFFVVEGQEKLSGTFFIVETRYARPATRLQRGI